MLPLLEVSLMLCLVNISDEVWAEKLPPEMRNEFVVASFCSEILTIVSFPFRER